MPSILLRTSPTADTGEPELIQLSAIVEEADWLGLFDQLQLFRSTQDPGGPFEEITGSDWSSPRLPKDGGDEPSSPVTGPLINIVGKELLLEVGTRPISITFTGTDPLTHSQVATQITQQSFGMLRSYVDDTGKIVIEGVFPGISSKISISLSEAAIILALPTEEPENTAQGKDPRIHLIQGQSLYQINDPFGSREYHYRTRFFNSSTSSTSDFSITFSGKSNLGVGITNTIVGYVSLVDINGKSLVNNEVRVYNEFDGSQTGGKIIAGGSKVTLTDSDGRAEFTLVRGQKITVSVHGTSLVRTITVPIDPSIQTFDLFDPNIGEVDVFKVSVPDIITAERRTL